MRLLSNLPFLGAMVSFAVAAEDVDFIELDLVNMVQNPPPVEIDAASCASNRSGVSLALI